MLVEPLLDVLVTVVLELFNVDYPVDLSTTEELEAELLLVVVELSEMD